MIAGFDLDGFIARRVTGRARSLFADDLAANDDALRAALEGRSLLVIGGAGTIGGAFVREALRYRPSRLVVVDLSENGLTELTRDLRSTAGQYLPDDFTTYPIDFGSATFARLLRAQVESAQGPFDVVAHFAAHKHVRSEKDRFSIEAMVGNNVRSTVALLDLLAGSPPSRFFCVSTDKAANPANVMGASKKLMEGRGPRLCGRGTRAGDDRAVRERRVQQRLAPGGVPRAHREGAAALGPADVKRFFVSPEESGQLCLAAAVLGRPGDIAFPRLGESTMLTFDRIADALLEELGYTPERYATEEEARRAVPGRESTWPVHYFASDTSGEKSAEEFHTADEPVDLERFAAIGIVAPGAASSVAGIRETSAELGRLFERETLEKAEIVEVLARLVPTFRHVETGRRLDSRM